MKCISIVETVRRKKDEEYEFRPLTEQNVVYDDVFTARSTSEIVDAVNSLVEESNRIDRDVNALETLVLIQQSTINHLASRIEALEKIIADGR